MAAKKKGTAFTLVLDADKARVRKAHAPVSRVHADPRRKTPRRRPDLLAEWDDSRRDD